MKLPRFEKIILKITIGLEIICDVVLDFLKTKIAKTIFSVLILSGSLYFVLTYNPTAQSLPSCDTLASNVTPNVGVNCLYFGLPQCKDVATPAHRTNCADLVDLPLCSDIVVSGGNAAKPGKNCVDLCSASAYNDPDPAASPPLERGVDYAVFNKDCMRFCDELEVGITANPGVNCANRKCHQVASGVTPTDGTNCNIVNCNLLTPDELNKTKFDDQTKKYCEGNIKCYNFTQAQLPFMKLRSVNPTCKIHECAPTSASCGASDVLNITNQGTGYTSVYQTYINAGFDINSNAVCQPTNCRPVIRSQYRCTTNGTQITGDNALDTVRNNACDATGDGAACGGNYCYLTIDCNALANANRSECAVATNTPPINGEDPFNSWFYRPRPMDKATQGNGIIRSNMRDDICYQQGAMEDNGWGRRITIDLGELGDIDLGWFTDYLGFDTRSPGACGASRSGHRGSGYGYLCGIKGNIFDTPYDYVAYFKGYASTDFSGSMPKHKVTVCLRFTNTMTTNACGSRECGITAAFSEFWGQTCGGDVCRELEVDDSSSTSDCNITSGGSMSAGCADTIDDFMRVRAVKYHDKICAYLDSKGQVAYNKMFMDGSELLNDGITCVNDPDGSGVSGCHGHDSNGTEAEASGWRALMKVHYVDNNRPNMPRGYLDKAGKLFPEQECPKVTLRIPPPNLYNLATVANSQRLFSPPLYVRSVSMARGEPDAIPAPGSDFGKTDFHFPEFKIQFGTTIAKMSLGIGYTGYEAQGDEENYPISPSKKTISTTLNGRTYEASLFVRKEYSENGAVPIFCVYRNVLDANGVALDPVKYACVERERPYIDNSFERIINPALPARKVLVYPKAGNQFNSAKLVMRYLASYGANNSNNNCGGDDICSPELELGAADFNQIDCSNNLESFKVCAQRDECSKLNIECIQNEVDLRNAEIANQSTTSFLGIRNNCVKNILPLCNLKKGITDSSGASIYNQNPSDADGDPKAYGWFNDLCVTKGFEKRLLNVVSHKTSSGIMGKCKTSCDIVTPMIGYTPSCPCIIAPDNYPSASDEIVRKQTPREAGLCIDMPEPQLCPAIDHNPTPNSDLSDFDYIISSLGKNSYNNSTGVNLSHQYRSQGKSAPDPIPVAGHAEFPKVLIGMADIYGECRGYWTYQKNGSGIIQKPTMSCLNINGNAVWEAITRNSCTRYSCDAILTTGPDASGVYQGNYGKDEPIDLKGRTNGYATWPKYTKTNDFIESANAIACIYGFQPNGSSAIRNSNNIITGYSGGNLPTRKCNQLGQWESLYPTNNSTNACTRISCPAISPPPNPAINDDAAWDQWYNSGGATFPSVEASRSNIRIQPAAISYGTCNNNLGFFLGGQPPTISCDYLGNWSAVSNPCVTTCSEIANDNEAKSLNNGYSRWAAITSEVNSQGVEGTFNGCATGYVTNPYPPKTDINGIALSDSVANDITRPAEDPKRLCKVGTTDSGVSASVWAAVNNGCINQCPGYDVDTRIGVGATTHTTSTGSVTLQWPSTALGADAYVTNWNGVESQFSAQYFIQGRTNNYYLMKRHCNADGKWSDPQAMCMANTGQIGNATYLNESSAAGYVNSVIAGDNTATETLTGSCIPGYWRYNNDTGGYPKRNCVFESGNSYINKTYLALSGGTNDCEVKTCPPLAASKGVRTKFGAVSGYSVAGTQIQGSCLMNETNSAGTTMYTTLSGVSPTRNCQDDGTWSAVVDETNCKKGCDFSGNHYPINRSGCGNGFYYWYNCNGGGCNYQSGFNMKHGQSLTFVATDNCGGGCDSETRGFFCSDGFAYANTISYSGSSCTFATYIPATNSFSGYINLYVGAYASNGVNYAGHNKKIGIPYIDKTGVARTFEVYARD